MPEARELFTAEEIADIVRRNDIEAVVSPFMSGVNGEQTHIDCRSGNVFWWIDLGNAQPFHGHMEMTAATSVATDPFHFVNNWNQTHSMSTAIIFDDDETDSVSRAENGEFFVIIKSLVSFVGAVTPDHLEFVTFMFHDDICELFGSDAIDQDDDQDDDDKYDDEVDDEKPVRSSAPSPIAEIVLEGIHALLEVNGALSSRAIARELGIAKHDVNSVLYRNIDQFVRHADQPPKWESKRP